MRKTADWIFYYEKWMHCDICKRDTPEINGKCKNCKGKKPSKPNKPIKENLEAEGYTCEACGRKFRYYSGNNGLTRHKSKFCPTFFKKKVSI